jgi:hypothetical protein
MNSRTLSLSKASTISAKQSLKPDEKPHKFETYHPPFSANITQQTFISFDAMFAVTVLSYIFAVLLVKKAMSV